MEEKRHLTEAQRAILLEREWYRSDTSNGDERWFAPKCDHTRIYGDGSCQGKIDVLATVAVLLVHLTD
jgi:hypothetical protein